MTLNTAIVATTPCDGHDVFYELRRLLGAGENVKIRESDRGSRTYTHATTGLETPFWPGDEGVWEIEHPPGSGLDAWLSVEYRRNLEPRRTPEESARRDEECEPDCAGFPGCPWHEPACWVEAHLDTAYGYMSKLGGCGALHAHLIFDLGQWFDERKIGWGWRNEFTGEWHFEDKYAALKELVDGGGQAMAWFVETVQPLVEEMVGPHGKVVWS